MATIKQLENDHVKIAIADDFSAELVDKKKNTRWQMSSCCYQEIGALSDMAVWNRNGRCYMDRYPSFFKARTLDSGSIEVTILDPLREERGKLVCSVTLDAEWINLSIDKIDDRLPSLIFPPYIEAEKLVIPNGFGMLINEPVPESRFIMPASGWNMRWFGGLRGNDGWIIIADEGYPESGVYMSQFAACVGWQKPLGKWSGKRVLKIGFTSDSHVGMARKYKKYAIEKGFHHTLKEKMESRPALKNLIGGRCISFFQGYTMHADNSVLFMSKPSADALAKNGKVQVIIPHKDVLTIIKEAKDAGMKRGYFNIRGWLKGGYDDSHPDVWPPEPQLGSMDEFKQIMAQPDPYVALLHDNYQDMYTQTQSFPKYVMKNPDGRLRAGGTWHGGRCYVVNSMKALEFAKRNWEQYKTIGLRGIFLDTIGAAHFQEDYSPEHPLTRTQDAESKPMIAKFFSDQGLIIGTEYGSDYSIREIDFVETRTTRVPNESIPLFQLVFHDSIVTTRYSSNTDDFTAPDDKEDMLWGYAKMWPAGDLANWRKNMDAFKKSLRVDELHARIGLDDMVNHRFLNSEGTVEQTEFSSGVSVIANFSNEDYSTSGKVVKPNDVLVLG